ncbi:MAG: VirB3 family type IV secretion system protein, partial [Acetobacteraceae bacterium]|nr:VirB3 family type IV secretion system protein [Acetobacteraceae bacterium]
MTAGQSSANAGAAQRFRALRAAPIGAPIHQSLVNPVLIAGMERGPAITLLTAIVTLILGPGFHVYTLALAAGLLLVGPWCLAKLANYDPQFEAIIIRYSSYDRVYDADVPYYPAPAGWLESWTSFTGPRKTLA